MRSDGNDSKCGGRNCDGSDAPAASIDDRTGCGTRRGGDGDVSETSWFEPVDTDATTNCPGGVCPVPWAVQEKRPELFDNVLKPKHYNSSGIECIEGIEAQLTPEGYKGFLQGNCAKYLWRWRDKGGIEDLRKCKWYLDRLISMVDDEP